MQPIIKEKDEQTSPLELVKLLPHIQQHFQTPIVPLYYLDFTLSVILGNAFLLAAAGQENWSLAQIVCMLLAVLGLFRATAFVHETYHVYKRIKGFDWYYNLLHGFLYKLPLYSYTPHRHHHLPETYGTKNDPEYETLGHKPAFYNLVFGPWVLMIFLPLFVIFRWGVMPFFMPFFSEKTRRKIYVSSSTIVMNIHYRRPEPSDADMRECYIQDAGCAIYTLISIALVAFGVLPMKIVVLWYIVLYMIAMMNFYRTMLNHRYFTNFEPTSHKLQILDTITLPFSLWNGWLYPVGLGYHALHHMFPQIPYHDLGKVHRWLVETLPENHPYRAGIIKNYRAGIMHLVTRKF